MTMTSKQYAASIATALKGYQKGEDSLDVAVNLAIRHATIYRAPDQLQNVHAAMIANSNTGLAKKFRNYVRETSAWVWNEKTYSFSLRKKIDEQSEDFFEAWNKRLGESWRIDADKADTETKAKPISREEGVKRALKRATVHTQADREAAMVAVSADMTNDEIYAALAKAGKIEGLLAFIESEMAAAEAA